VGNATAAEIVNQICEYIDQSVSHWSSVPHISSRAKCIGVANSMLIMLDGGMSLFPFTLMSMDEAGNDLIVNADCSLVAAFQDYMRSKSA
jgi:hypothetical protein